MNIPYNPLNRGVAALFLILFNPANPCSAQTKTKWFKSVRRAQCVCYAYNDKDSLLGRSNGVFVGDDGRVVTQYDLLKGASRIDIVMADGRRTTAPSVAAVNATYNAAVLATTGKMSGPDVATTDAVGQERVFVMPPLTGSKHTLCKDAVVARADQVDGDHHYYSLQGQRAIDSDASLASVFNADEEGLPMLNADGRLVALTQHDSKAAPHEERLYGVSARQIMQAPPSPMSMLAADYLRLALPLLLPADRQQAETMLFLFPRNPLTRFRLMAEQYVQRYPRTPYGYVTLAEAQMQAGDRASATATYEQALKAIKEKGRDEVLFSWARALATDTATYTEALALTDQAIAVSPQPIYSKLRADILMDMHRTDEARDIYLSLTGTPLRSADLFLSAALCTPPSDTLHLCLLDSAVACLEKPYPKDALQLFWLRAAARHDAGKYRLAVADYNEFQHLSAGRASAEFYYRRSLSELQGRLYQQAIDDAHEAVNRQSDNTVYLVHLANAYLRIGDHQQARVYLQQAAALGEPAAQQWLDSHPIP